MTLIVFDSLIKFQADLKKSDATDLMPQQIAATFNDHLTKR